MKETIKQVIAQEAQAIQNIPVEDGMVQAVNIIFERVQKKRGKLVTSGMGKAGQIALNIATTFSSTGTPAVFLHPSESQHGDLGVLQENDVLLVINPEGILAKSANAFIYTGNPKEVCPLGLSPTTSTTVMTVIGDALVVSMMLKIGFTNEDYAKRHHGGYLGDKSRSQAKTEKK